MRRVNKHPIVPGTTVFPRIRVNYPHTIGLQQIVEGQATVTGIAATAHRYVVVFEGETEPCERELHEMELGEGVAA